MFADIETTILACEDNAALCDRLGRKTFAAHWRALAAQLRDFVALGGASL